MIVNNQPTSTDFRHNIFRLALLIATLLLFIVHVTFQQLSNRGNNRKKSQWKYFHFFLTVLIFLLLVFFSNKTLRPEDIFPNEISPSEWVYGSFDAFTYFWQVQKLQKHSQFSSINFLSLSFQFSWLLYCLTLIFRRSANGFLYLSPNTFTPSFFFSFTAGFLLQTVWICFFQRHFFLVKEKNNFRLSSKIDLLLVDLANQLALISDSIGFMVNHHQQSSNQQEVLRNRTTVRKSVANVDTKTPRKFSFWSNVLNRGKLNLSFRYP